MFLSLSKFTSSLMTRRTFGFGEFPLKHNVTIKLLDSTGCRRLVVLYWYHLLVFLVFKVHFETNAAVLSPQYNVASLKGKTWLLHRLMEQISSERVHQSYKLLNTVTIF